LGDQEEMAKMGITNVSFYFADGAGHNYVFWDDVIPRILDFVGI
jgi:S-formylglutathione hydrolase FrmB